MDEASAFDSPIEISIIVVTHNSSDALETSLGSWRIALEELSSRGVGAWEIIIVDNASCNNSCEELSGFGSGLRIIKLGKNLGFGAGCNVGAREARGANLLFLNPDVSLDSEALFELLDALNKLDGAGAVTARMRNSDGTFQSTCRNLPTALNIFASRGSIIGEIIKRVSPSSEYTLPDSSRPMAVPAASGTCLALRRDFFSELGGFDERFFMFFEDTDLSKRINELGQNIYFVPTAGGVHSWGGSSESKALARARWHHRSALTYFRKHHPGFFTSIVLPLALGLNFLLKALANPFQAD